jgi:transposase InsO family protein
MSQRAPLTEAEKQYIQTRKQVGATLTEIASEVKCSHMTTRKWWRRFCKNIPTGPRGRPVRGVLSMYPAEIADGAIHIKRAHPHWGPANVKLELKRQLVLSEDSLPSDSRLAALFKSKCPEYVQPRRQRHYPTRQPLRAHLPHQRWQIDGKEKVSIGEKEVATLLDIRDPEGALMIGCQAIVTTTEKGWRKLTLAEIQEVLRRAFTDWGCPLEIQTDHEVVYTGSPATDFPTRFTLWLVGLGMTHILSREGRPTDQAQVERNHRTMGDMVFKDEHFDTLPELQTTLEDRRQRYNWELPVVASDCQGRPPLVAHPSAVHSGRPFHPMLEWSLFQMERVEAYLAQGVWTRQISASGNVAIGDHLYYVGRGHLKEIVSVRFLPDKRSFQFQVVDGTVIKESPAVGLEKIDLIGYMPLEEALPMTFQLPLPLVGV